ncbi:MAG: helix-turn-helix domain-containing protein [Candidatus Hodarchaeales archaeon]|jgi:excisionase family DNA binding protein
MEENKGNKRQVLSVKEFSEIIGVPQSTVRRWLQKGDIKGTQIGRKWLIPATEAEKIINPQ